MAACAALTGIIFVLKSGIPWGMPPQELGCGSGVTSWRRLRGWQQAGVWHRLHRVLLDRPGQADRIDWSRASVDSASVPAKGGRDDRAEPDGSRHDPCGVPGTKRPVVVDRGGIPLAIGLTAANRPDDVAAKSERMEDLLLFFDIMKA